MDIRIQLLDETATQMIRVAVSFKHNFVYKNVCKCVCGDGRTRTAVQTPHQRAFYTLSLALVFDRELPPDRLLKAYPLNLSGA